MTAASAAGLAGCRPARSAYRFLTSPPLRAAEVRKQLHRTAPSQAKKQKQDQDQKRGGTLNPAPGPARPRGSRFPHTPS